MPDRLAIELKRLCASIDRRTEFVLRIDGSVRRASSTRPTEPHVAFYLEPGDADFVDEIASEIRESLASDIRTVAMPQSKRDALMKRAEPALAAMLRVARGGGNFESNPRRRQKGGPDLSARLRHLGSSKWPHRLHLRVAVPSSLTKKKAIELMDHATEHMPGAVVISGRDYETEIGFKTESERDAALRIVRGEFAGVLIATISEIRSNPSSPEVSAAAIGMYKTFWRLDPRKIDFNPTQKMPGHAGLAGSALEVLYRSGKVDPSTGIKPSKPENYIHEHDGDVNVYRTDLRSGLRPVPSFISDCEELVLLGECLGFAYDDGDSEIQAEMVRPYPKLYTIPSGKALVVVQDQKTVLALIWGGRLGVEGRGIVH